MSLIKKIAVGVAGLVVLLVVIGLGAIRWIGAWNLVFPSDDFETTPPEIPADFGQGADVRVLVFSKTNSFRHSEGIDAARKLFEELAPSKGWALYHSENGALFDAEHLARFDVVVFSNATGNMLSDQQDAAFRSWLEAGGGWVGIHSAGDGSHEEWTWYHDTLIGGEYAGHILGPQTQEARVVVEDRTHPVTRGLPADYRHSEEWYSWKESARVHGMNVLITVDESSYEPWIRAFGDETDIRMQDHPIVWWRCVGRGRALYSAMGHWGAAYESQNYSRLLGNAIDWAAVRTGSQCAVSAGE